MLIKQRDNEIAILVNYLNKKGGGNPEDTPGVPVHRENDRTQASISSTQEEHKDNGLSFYQMMRGQQPQPKLDKSISDKRKDFEQAQQSIKREHGIVDANELTIGPVKASLEDLADRTKAFELFRKSYRKNEAMEDNRNILKDKYARGKALGQSVNDIRNQIKDLTNQIEQIRKQNALRGLVDENGEVIRTPEENQL